MPTTTMVFTRPRWTLERIRDLLRATDDRTDTLVDVARTLRDRTDDIDAQLTADQAALQALADTVDTRLAAAQNRILALEAARHRADLVAALPANAPVGYLARLQGDLTGALYMGNGPNQPLTRMLPVTLA